jgi:Polyketide cyclase / dehydrase and lipid transport
LAITYGGPEEGKGAQIQWTSQKPAIGTGNMEISNSNLNRSVELAANFNNLEGTSTFEIAPSGSGSKITWSFGYDTGSSPLKRWKALMLDGFIGSEYRAGLDKLKEKVEADRRPLTAPTTSPTLSVTPSPGVSSQPEQVRLSRRVERLRQGSPVKPLPVHPQRPPPDRKRQGRLRRRKPAPRRQCPRRLRPPLRRHQRRSGAGTSKARNNRYWLELLLCARLRCGRRIGLDRFDDEVERVCQERV